MYSSLVVLALSLCPNNIAESGYMCWGRTVLSQGFGIRRSMLSTAGCDTLIHSIMSWEEKQLPRNYR